MKRRRLLARSGLALTVPFAGCLSAIQSQSDEAAGTTTEPSQDSGDGGRLVVEWSGNDVPPYDIPSPDAKSGWNPDYLGENMASTPSLPFEWIQVDEPARTLLPDSRGEWTYGVRVLDSVAERDDVLDIQALDPTRRKRLTGIDFDESTLVLVGECCGSSSIEHRWVRVEERSSGVQLHGYLWKPKKRAGGVYSRYSVLEVSRPADKIDYARVSLTVEEQTRLHFDSRNDPVEFIPALVANDRDERLTVGIEITTGAGETRADGALDIERETRWQDIGFVGHGHTEYTVDVRVESLGIDVTSRYDAATAPLGIRIDEAGEVMVESTYEMPHEPDPPPQSLVQ